MTPLENTFIGALVGGVLTTIGAIVKTNRVQKNLDKCREDHKPCPEAIIDRVDAVVAAHISGVSKQIADCQERLGVIENHMMNGGKR